MKKKRKDDAIYSQLQRTADWVEEYYDCSHCVGAKHCREGKYCYKDYFTGLKERHSEPNAEKLPSQYKWLKGVIL